ncbi:MAG: sulfotransferase family protein [Verrucomicrobiales bacterium]
MSRPIFLLSLPRSGSTLLQRLLLAEGRCATLGEPSLLLRFLGDDEVLQRRATYWESLLEVAQKDMRKEWSGYDAAYQRGVRDLVQRIYDGLAGDREWFLDKTPRYTLIAEELIQTFPEAKFIVLWRHPLAVASSMCATYREGRWCPDEFGIDLFEGMNRLRRFVQVHGDSVCELRYEDLVENPARELKRLGDYLGWESLETVAEVELPTTAGGTLGDSTGVKQYASVSSKSRDAWRSKVDNWYRVRWCRRYWQGERAKHFEGLGYEMPSDLRGGGLLSGLLDWLAASWRIRRRITQPTWLRRHARSFRRRHGFGVLFR